MAQSARCASTHLSTRIVPPANTFSLRQPAKPPGAKTAGAKPTRARHISQRLGGIARRSLAAWLVAAAGTVGGIGGGEAIAHDHPIVTDAAAANGASAGLAGAANRKTDEQRAAGKPWGDIGGGQAGVSPRSARLDGETSLIRWLESEEAARVACDHALRAEAFDTIAAMREVHARGFVMATPSRDTRDPSERIAEAMAALGRLRLLVTRDDFAAKWMSASAALDARNAFGIVSGAANDSVQAESRKVSRGLADLARQEPVDVIPPVASRSASPSVAPAGSEVAAAGVEEMDGVTVVAAQPPQFGQFGLVGGSGIVATMADSYLPYDLSPEDAIAMRMYPISGPSIGQLAGRRTGIYAPVEGLASGTQWHHRIEPATILSTPGAASGRGGASGFAAARSASPMSNTAGNTASDGLAREAEKMVATVARIAVEAVQPDSVQRELLAPDRLGTRIGELASVGWGAVDGSANDLVGRLAQSMRPAVSTPPSGQPSGAIGGERLVAGATLLAPHPVVSTDWEDRAMDGRALRIEIACRAAIDGVIAQASRGSFSGESSLRQDTLAYHGPAEHSGAADPASVGPASVGPTSVDPEAGYSGWASLEAAFSGWANSGWAGVQAALPRTASAEVSPGQVAQSVAAQPDSAPSDMAAIEREIVRAEAVATAFDQAAGVLERLAMSLRRAGDSVVRQAKAKPAGGGSIVR